MKKFFIVFFISVVLGSLTFAVPTKYNETHEENWTNLSYVNVPILKVLDSTEGYVVIYQKNKIGVSQTTIPKKWAKGNVDSPRKLKVRELTNGKLKPFMTIIKKDGNFQRVILTVPRSKQDSTWGVVGRGKKLDDIDKETLEEIEL